LIAADTRPAAKKADTGPARETIRSPAGLELLGLAQPGEMDGRSLLAGVL
jgi:hypothetical protein